MVVSTLFIIKYTCWVYTVKLLHFCWHILYNVLETPFGNKMIHSCLPTLKHIISYIFSTQWAVWWASLRFACKLKYCIWNTVIWLPQSHCTRVLKVLYFQMMQINQISIPVLQNQVDPWCQQAAEKNLTKLKPSAVPFKFTVSRCSHKS
jgi:hypothetical protein